MTVGAQLIDAHPVDLGGEHGDEVWACIQACRHLTSSLG